MDQNCGGIPVLGLICEGLSPLLRFVGNSFFFAYYASTGDWGVITKAILTQAYSDMVSLFNDHIANHLNPILDQVQNGVNGSLDNITSSINDQISSTEASINDHITTEEQAINEALLGLSTDFATMVNLVPGVIMNAIGYTPDSQGNYKLPIPVNITNITTQGFEIYVPQDGLVLNYAALAL